MKERNNKGKDSLPCLKGGEPAAGRWRDSVRGSRCAHRLAMTESRKNLHVIPRPVRSLVVGIRNTPAPRTRRADCHSRCAHRLRNDIFSRSAVDFFVVRRGGALPLPQATARVVPTDAYKGYRWDGSRRRVPPHREKRVYFEGSHNCRSGVPRRAFAREWKRIGRYGEGPREQLGEVRGTAGRRGRRPLRGCAGVIPRPPHS